jgi:histidyl-tRNA synthetase
MKYQTPRGTHDLLGEDLLKFLQIENTVQKQASKYGFEEIRTPVFEYLNVFEKNIGESTDIVNKEMYVFEDKSQEKLVLRPEGTAPVVRALISNGLTHKLPLKLYYSGAMFRYERPQKGRQRQFHQIGFEYLGTLSYTSDVESINLAIDILKSLGITSFKVLINSLGSVESLNKYKTALVEFLKSKKSDLSEESLIRLEKNPLRILDSKKEEDKQIIKDAPKINEFYDEYDKNFFNSVLEGLKALNIDFEVDYNLVRGLDYYTHTVFEIVTTDLGSQGTLIAGGRYNNLIKNMGGPDAGAFGFAAGMERLALMMQVPQIAHKNVAMITLDDKSPKINNYALALAEKIRNNTGFGATFILGKDIGAKLKKLDVNQYTYALIIGEDEFNGGMLTIKNLQTFTQEKIKADDILKVLEK